MTSQEKTQKAPSKPEPTQAKPTESKKAEDVKSNTNKKVPIDIFANVKRKPAGFRTIRKVKELNWLNVTGPTKVGKTQFLINLACECRVAHFDFEKGTRAHVGQFVEVDKWADSMGSGNYKKSYSYKKDVLMKLSKSGQLDLDYIALDPLDEMYRKLARWYCEQNDAKTLSDIPHGKGWHEVTEQFAAELKLLSTIAPLITVTHVKLSTNESDERILELDVPGKAGSHIKANADAHALMTSERDDEGNSYAKVAFSPTKFNRMSYGGARLRDMYHIKTEQQLIDYLVAKANARKERRK